MHVTLHFLILADLKPEAELIIGLECSSQVQNEAEW